MPEINGKHWLERLRKQWVILGLLQFSFNCLSITCIAGVMLMHFLHFPVYYLGLIWIICLCIALIFKPVWKISAFEISRYVNMRFPELEESAALLLRNRNELSFIERFQQDKITSILPGLERPKEPMRKFQMAMLLFIATLLVSFGLSKIPNAVRELQPSSAKQIKTPLFKENRLPQLSEISIEIVPPAYTGLPSRNQKQFLINAETGSKINWKMETSGAVRSFRLIFNDKESIRLTPQNPEGTHWAYTKLINSPGFYQVEIDGKKSDLYQIGLIPDLPVAIKILKPAQRTSIDIGQPQRIELHVELSDDYGIREASISATMASGKGEGVSFTEKNLAFDQAFHNERISRQNKSIDLKSLGMKPGDELYLFVKATDNHGQSSRSDVYFVSIVDTTELMSMAGMSNGVNLVPEYFRSQRQIIIDTEKLLKEQAGLSSDDFKNRSNNLGIDQKLLRLRYGQFLGEENETEIGGDHDDHDEGKGKEEKFGDATAIMDKYAHKHDIAEDATFFEPEMKAQLKAVLTEMWNSELKLRTYKPQVALPYEYKALRLLKDLQQKSRAYVAKTTIKTPGLKPEKRLSGELDKIMQPVQRMTVEQKDQRTAYLRNSLAILENFKSGKALSTDDRYLLRETEKYMIGAAADHPATYLESLGSLRKISSSGNRNLKNIETVQQAIQKMIKPEASTPGSQENKSSSGLYQNYLKNLNQAGR